MFNDTLQCTDSYKKEKIKQYSDNRKKALHSELNVGAAVLVCERKMGKLMTPFNSKNYKVTKTKGTMITVQRGRCIATRHISHLKPLQQCTSIPLINSTNDETDDSDDISRPQEHRNYPKFPERPVQMREDILQEGCNVVLHL